MSRPGQMDRRVTFQRRNAGGPRDEYGHTRPGYTDVVSVMAHVAEITARDRMRLPQVLASRSATVTIRYRTDITPDLFVVYEGRRYRITSGPVERGPRRAQLEMVVEEVEIPA